MQIKELEKPLVEKTYDPDKEEQVLRNFVDGRIMEMQDFRKNLGVEKEWKEADEEYLPHELDMGVKRKRFEQDQDTGLRSRVVPVGDNDEDWRSRNSAPILLAKIQTAVGVIVDNNPEAMLTALTKKNESSTNLIYSLWKRNWQINDSKEILKLFAFNDLKYGWAVGRSFPKIIKYKKSILDEIDTENSDNNKYEEKEIIWFNDVARQNLDPWRTWIDEQTKPYDIYSMNDCYYEMDFSYDAGQVEFGRYSNWQYVKKDSKFLRSEDKTAKESPEEQKIRKDIVTVGFYENRLKDIFIIYIPKDKIVLHKSPLPNDDGMLSLWHAPWILRNSNSPYGISLWTIIRQDKELYDKMNNMTMDQLVLSIMKFGFYTGTDAALGDGKIKIVPGQARKVTNGEVKWMEIPGPGREALEGRKQLNASMDDASGITPQLQGELSSKTLGEAQMSRESSLKRLKVPLENIVNAIEQDAYLTVSWMSQVYSTPEVKTFSNDEKMQAYNEENEIEANEVSRETNPVTGEPGEIQATYLPQLSLHLEGRDGQLFESKESQFFQVGKDILPSQIKWRGIFKVIPKSLLGSSEIIIKQTKNELFNLLVPLLSMPPEIAKNPAIQLCEANEEDPKDWLPDSWMQPQQPIMTPEQPGVEGGEEQPQGEEEPLFTPKGQQGGGEEQPLFTPRGGGQAPTVVPKGQVAGPTPRGGLGGLLKSMFKR